MNTHQRPVTTSATAIVSLVVGLISVLLPFGFIPGIIALALGVDGLRAVRAGLRSGRGLAIAGIILGCVGIAFFCVKSLAS